MQLTIERHNKKQTYLYLAHFVSRPLYQTLFVVDAEQSNFDEIIHLIMYYNNYNIDVLVVYFPCVSLTIFSLRQVL